MRPIHRFLTSLTLGIAMIASMATLGCASRSRVRVYDPYRSDYHHWDRRESVYYNQWEVENHYGRRDYDHLNRDEQRRYWEWRHEHRDHGRHHDRDDDRDRR